MLVQSQHACFMGIIFKKGMMSIPDKFQKSKFTESNGHAPCQ